MECLDGVYAALEAKAKALTTEEYNDLAYEE